MKRIIYVSCTRADKGSTDLHASLVKLGAERAHFFEHNRDGLSSRYNEFFDGHAGEDAIAVFVHDDVRIEDAYVVEKLRAGAETFVVQGLAGAATFSLQGRYKQTVWFRAPRQHLSGAVDHPLRETASTLCSSYGPTPRRCVVLDGLFLAVDLARIGAVRFDPALPFHFYDLDFCLSCFRAGLPVGTVNIHVHHRSAGSFTSEVFFATQRKFREKWKDWPEPAWVRGLVEQVDAMG